MRRLAYIAADFITETNLFIGVGAALFAGSTFWFFGLSANVELLGLIFCGTVFTYNFQRRIGDLDGSARYPRAKTALMYAGAIGSIYFARNLGIGSFSLLGAAAALSLAYALPVFPGKGQQKERYSLRKIPYLKAWIILAAWMLTAVGAPYFDPHFDKAALPAIDILIFTVQQGSLLFALAAAFDIRDLRLDAPTHKTLPQMLGTAGTVRLAANALLVSGMACALLYLSGKIDVAALALHAAIILAAYTLVRKTTPDRGPLFFALLIDGVLLMQGAGAWTVMIL